MANKLMAVDVAGAEMEPGAVIVLPLSLSLLSPLLSGDAFGSCVVAVSVPTFSSYSTSWTVYTSTYETGSRYDVRCRMRVARSTSFNRNARSFQTKKESDRDK